MTKTVSNTHKSSLHSFSKLLFSLFILMLPVFMLLSIKGSTGLIITIAAYCAVSVALLILGNKYSVSGQLRIKHPVVVTFIACVLGCIFYLRWNSSGRVSFISEEINMPVKQIYLIISAALSGLSVFGVDYIVCLISAIFGLKEAALPRKIERFLYVLACSVIFITLNSQSSPLYPLNTWDDVNTIYTVGKSVLRGMVPYRDLYEQKGPLLLFMQAPAAAISFTTHHGLWLIEIICAFFFLLLALKTADLYTEKYSWAVIPPLALVTYCGQSFHAGGSAEEYCLPLMMYGIYLGCRSLKENSLPSRKELFLLGAAAGAVLWMKYSMVGIFIGCAAAFAVLLIRKGQKRDIIQAALFCLLGVLAVTLPIIIYFLVNKSFSFLWKAYFYNNLLLYPDNRLSLRTKIARGLANYVEFGLYSFFLFVIGLFHAYSRKGRDLFVFLLVSAAGLFAGTYSGGHFYTYYSFCFSVFTVFGLIAFLNLATEKESFSELMSSFSGTLKPILLFFCVTILCLNSQNMFVLRHSREDLVQYQLKTVLEENGYAGDPVVLSWTYGELGMNTIMGIVPRLRFFCWYNNEQNLENIEYREKCVEENCADMIITVSKAEDDHPDFPGYVHSGALPGVFGDDYRYFHYFLRED